MPYRADSTRTYTAGNNDSAWGINNRQGDYGVGGSRGSYPSGTAVFAPRYANDVSSQYAPAVPGALSVGNSAGGEMRGGMGNAALLMGRSHPGVGLPSRFASGQGDDIMDNPMLLNWIMGLLGNANGGVY